MYLVAAQAPHVTDFVYIMCFVLYHTKHTMVTR